jgi:hypothetical protein
MPAAGSFYGKATFNPKLILTQIACMQTGFYVVLCMTNWIFSFLFGANVHLSHLFDSEEWAMSTNIGVCMVFSLFSTAAAMAILLSYVVERSKKCADFVSTYHIIHLMMTALWRGFPTSFTWWMYMFISGIGASLAGERVCMHYEIQDIHLPK